MGITRSKVIFLWLIQPIQSTKKYVLNHVRLPWWWTRPGPQEGTFRQLPGQRAHQRHRGARGPPLLPTGETARHRIEQTTPSLPKPSALLQAIQHIHTKDGSMIGTMCMCIYIHSKTLYIDLWLMIDNCPGLAFEDLHSKFWRRRRKQHSPSDVVLRMDSVVLVSSTVNIFSEILEGPRDSRAMTRTKPTSSGTYLPAWQLKSVWHHHLQADLWRNYFVLV